jgi:hypothetical protein
MASFYIDSTSFDSATAVYTTSALTTKATDGVYAVCGYYRTQQSGVLLPGIFRCDAACASPCGTNVEPTDNQKGWYEGHYDTGSAVGAIKVTMTNASSSPVAFIVELGGDAYPDPSVPRRQPRASDAPGAELKRWTCTANPCNPDTTAISMTVYQKSGAGWFNTTGSITEYIDDISVPEALYTYWMYIPKVTNQYSIIDYAVLQPCTTNYDVTLTIDCPVLLPSFNAAGPFDTSEAALVATTYPIQVYHGVANGTPGTVDDYDFMFKDPYSSEFLDNKFYKLQSGFPAGTPVIQISNGLIIAFF